MIRRKPTSSCESSNGRVHDKGPDLTTRKVRRDLTEEEQEVQKYNPTVIDL